MNHVAQPIPRERVERALHELRNRSDNAYREFCDTHYGSYFTSYIVYRSAAKIVAQLLEDK